MESISLKTFEYELQKLGVSKNAAWNASTLAVLNGVSGWRLAEIIEKMKNEKRRTKEKKEQK